MAMGGGGFTMSEPSGALDRLVLELTGVPVPRICFLPTASGDPREQAMRFAERFSGWPCEPTVLSLFHLGRDRVEPREHLLAQDVIYVGGGSMRNMLAVWREHGVDQVMRAAWERGIVLAGLSAGSMCWFEGGVTMSGGYAAPVSGLGLLPGSLTVHLDGEPERMPVFSAAVGDGRLPAGWAVDDCAALVFRGTALSRCVASRRGARVFAVAPDGEGGVSRESLEVELLAGARTGMESTRTPVSSGGDGIAEMRELRAAQRRWR
jgi:dipeptidase E